MASYMMQLYVEQAVDSHVTKVYPLEAEAYLLTDPTKSTIVREIAVQRVGGILAANKAAVIGWSSSGFATVKLQASRGGSD